jgi:hypothetical protein
MSKLLLRSFFISSFCTSLLFAPMVHAQSLKAEQDKMVQLQTEQTTLSAQIKQLETEIAAKQTALATVKAKPTTGQDELAIADKALADAKAGYAANPNDTNQTILNNAEFKRHLVERKLLKAGGVSSADLQTQLQTSEAELVTLKNSMSTNASNIDAQKILLADTEKQAAANAEMAKQKAAEQNKVVEQEAVKQQALNTEKAKAAQQQADAAAEQAKVAAQQKQAEQQAATALVAKQTADAAAQKAAAESNGLVRLNDKAAVDKELVRITKLQETFWAKKKINEKMYLRRDGSDSKKSFTLRDLGNMQYRTEMVAVDGKSLLNIGFQKWELTFNPADAGQTFVFIYDQSTAEKPRLVYYLKSFE